MKTWFFILPLLFFPAVSHASDAFSGPDESFDVADAVPDQELAKMRGGFVTLSGLTIEFALNTRTLVDGALQNEVGISSRNLAAIDPASLRQVIQVGKGNEIAALDALAANPGIVSILQNSENDKLIQQFTTLDIDASGIAQFRNERLTPIIDFQSVTALR